MRAILFLCIFIPTSVFAVKGEYADEQFELKSSCKLKFFAEQAGEILSGTCTASYMGNKSFVTAEHCQDSLIRSFMLSSRENGPEKPYVICDGGEKIPLTRSDKLDGNSLDYAQDIAFFKTESDPKVSPIKMASSTEQVNDMMENNECYFNGYGLDNDDKHGELRAAKVKSFNAKVFSLFGGSNPFMFEIGGGNTADHGDSGGPVYCLNDKGEPIHMGVIHGNEKGSSYTKVERVTQSPELVQFYLNNENPNMDMIKKGIRVKTMCEDMLKCSNAMKELGGLSSDVGDIVSVLSKQTSSIFTNIVQGENVELQTIDQLWDELYKFWDTQDCYDKLY